MKVILRSDVSNLGRAGDILKVKPGYARNRLFPKKQAFPAHSQSLKEWKHKKKLAELKSKKAQALRNETAKKADGLKISIKKQTAPNGRLFGSVTAFEVAAELAKSGIQVDKKFIDLKEPIKKAGEYKLQVDFGKTSKAVITLHVQDEKPAEKAKTPSILSKIVGLGKPAKKEAAPSSKDSETKA